MALSLKPGNVWENYVSFPLVVGKTGAWRRFYETFLQRTPQYRHIQLLSPLSI